jgi:outer membrane protein
VNWASHPDKPTRAMNKILKYTLLAFLAISSATLHAQKTGHVNSIDLLGMMPEVAKADSTLKALQKELQQQYNTYLSEYQTKVNEYNAMSAEWGEVKREAAEQDIATLQQRITDFESSSQQKLEKRRQELYDPILEKANSAIEAVGKEMKFTYIMDTSGGNLVYIGDDMVDVLPLVLKRLGIEVETEQ